MNHMWFSLDLCCGDRVLCEYGLQRWDAVWTWALNVEYRFGHGLQTWHDVWKCDIMVSTSCVQYCNVYSLFKTLCHLYISCSQSIKSPLLPILSRQYTHFSVHGQSIHHRSCQYPVCTLSLLTMSCQNLMPFDHQQSEDLIFCHCKVSIPHALPKYSQYTIYHINFQIEYYLYCPYTINTPHLLPNFIQYISFPSHVTISPALVHSEMPPLLSMSSQNTNSTPHVEPVHSSVQIQFITTHTKVQTEDYHLFYSCPASRISLLSSSSQNTTSSAHVQVVHPLFCAWPVSAAFHLVHYLSSSFCYFYHR